MPLRQVIIDPCKRIAAHKPLALPYDISYLHARKRGKLLMRLAERCYPRAETDWHFSRASEGKQRPENWQSNKSDAQFPGASPD